MSNIAAAATIGSNHNSRAPDGEIRAGRGFWPGLSVTLKHSSCFASFVLISKGDYPSELNISFPFSLVNNNQALNRLEVMPAYFWMHNLYALERNTWKTLARDKRKIKKQRIEADYLAPDTAEEIIRALDQMELWMKEEGYALEDIPAAYDNHGAEDKPLLAKGLERHDRVQVILKPYHSRAAYRQMLLYYALKTMVVYLEGKGELSYSAFVDEMESDNNGRISEWVNLGGQIAPAFRVDELREKIRSGEIDSWEGIHEFYGKMASAYALDKTRHAWEVYRYLKENKNGLGESGLGVAGHPLKNAENFRKELLTLVQINRFITEQVYQSRAKDYDDPFRTMTFRNREEMDQVLGKAENSFVKLIRERTKLLEESTGKLSLRLQTQ